MGEVGRPAPSGDFSSCRTGGWREDPAEEEKSRWLGAKRWAGLEARAVLALRLAVGYGLNEKQAKLAAEYKVAAERRAVPLTRTTR